MRIAFDSGPLGSSHKVRGIGWMVKEQINALRNLKLKDVNIDTFDFQSKKGKRLLERKNYDIVHYSYFFPYSQTLDIKKYGKKVLVTIQDLINLIYPRNYPPGIRGRINFIRQKICLRNVDGVITVSETSKKDIVRFLRIPAEKIYVIYLAPRKIFRKLDISDRRLKDVINKYKLPDKFCLYVGDINYNKNVCGLISACRLAKIPLVIVGKHALEVENTIKSLSVLRGPRDWLRFLFGIPHPELAHFLMLLDEFKNTDKIIRTGFVSEKDLVALYNLASVYVQPSFYEGFGLPVLEAMASGCPVVVTRTNALTEIAGGSSLVADPYNPNDLAEKIIKVLKDSKVRQELVRQGFQNVRKYSWEKTGENMLAIYKQVINSHK